MSQVNTRTERKKYKNTMGNGGEDPLLPLPFSNSINSPRRSTSSYSINVAEFRACVVGVEMLMHSWYSTDDHCVREDEEE